MKKLKTKIFENSVLNELTNLKPIDNIKEGDSGSVTYLDYEETKSDNESISEIGLKMKTEKFEYENIRFDIRGGEKEFIQTIVRNELKDIASLCNKGMMLEGKNILVTKKPIKLNIFQRFWNWIRGVKPDYDPDEIDLMASYRRIITKILMGSNLIAASCRRGPASHIIVNTLMGTIIADSSGFTMNTNKIIEYSGLPYQIGTFSGMNVIVDPYMRWDDTRVLIYRIGESADQPGPLFIYESNGDIKTETKNTDSCAPLTEYSFIGKRMVLGSRPHDAYGMVVFNNKDIEKIM